MAKVSSKLGELIDALLDRFEFPADCRKLAEYFAKRGFEVSHSSLYAWKRGKQGISEDKKQKFAEALSLDPGKFNAYLDDRISLEQLESGDENVPLSGQDVIEWVLGAEPEELLMIQKRITEQLTRYFDSEFSSLESVLEYALNQLAETAIAEAQEKGERLPHGEAITQALEQFSISSEIKVKDLEAFFQDQKSPTPKQIEGIAEAIGWEVDAVQALVDAGKA